MSDALDVYLDGVLTGTLVRGLDGLVSFDYVNHARRTPLSLSMPIGQEHHGPAVVMPWLDDLLPDNDDVRARWAAQVGERRVTPFNLLRHFGADCAGAVQIMPSGIPPEAAGTLTPISEVDIAHHIRVLRGDAAAWDFAERGGRWSLGGQQGKFALTRGPGDGWSLPGGRSASTHIIKVGIEGVANSDVAEFVTMRIAASLGLPTAPVEYVPFDGELAVVATRFDRRAASDGDTQRLHQEDLCQALGLWRTMKYQSDGGPSAGDVVGLLRKSLDRRDRHRGVNDFVRVQVFNWLVAGTDAHAKNYALLHIGARTTLAPFYDLVSTAFLWPARELHFSGRLAMKFGGEYRFRKVDGGRYTQAAAALGVDEELLVGTARTYRDRVPDAVATALSDLPGVRPATRAHMLHAIVERLGYARVP